MAAVTQVVQLAVATDLAQLGPEWDALFAAGPGVQSSRAWIAATMAAAIPDGAVPALVAITDADGPLALLPMLAGPDRAWGSLTTPYTCLYQPLLRADAPPRAMAAGLRAFARYCRGWPVTRLEALDPDWPGLPALRRAFGRAGMVSRGFAHFGNWHEAVPTASWDAYLATRQGALRETIRRRTRAAQRDGTVRWTIARDGPALADALAAYEDVYARSWKTPEPFPDFNAALLRALSGSGVLRIGVMWQGETPIAAQYWSVLDGAATVLKLAHDERFKALSPGTVLTAASIQALIETDGVTELDFGRGDDPYKAAWVGQRRPRIGLLAINPRRRAGLRVLATHDAGGIVRVVRRFVEYARGGRTKPASAKSNGNNSAVCSATEVRSGGGSARMGQHGA